MPLRDKMPKIENPITKTFDLEDRQKIFKKLHSTDHFSTFGQKQTIFSKKASKFPHFIEFFRGSMALRLQTTRAGAPESASQTPKKK